MKRFLRKIFIRDSGALVLMYHRIATPAIDPWELCVSPENFEQQLLYLKQEYRVIPMQELTQRIQTREPLKNYIAITFDDGYRDNYTHAMPLLEKYSMPATFFFTLQFQAADKFYWWDELEQRILLTPTLPRHLSLSLESETFEFDLSDAATLTASQQSEMRCWHYGKPLYNARLELFYKLWALIKPASIAKQQSIMQTLRAWTGTIDRDTNLLMDAAQIQSTAQSSLFEIGAHTVNHPALEYLEAEEQNHEMQQSKTALETLTGKYIAGIAYPYGSMNHHTSVQAQAAAFRYAVSTQAGVCTHASDLYALPRFQVTNLDGEAFRKSIKIWQGNNR
ncbi:polysaccharide deacetylase family protein [Ohtaekwangia sp.]|uniref:polysaccharide deacetylase family protein n=1 Tax=Ohtaekwangia sp. TaxID=2066019 RepID=UPI002FDE8E21